MKPRLSIRFLNTPYLTNTALRLLSLRILRSSPQKDVQSSWMALDRAALKSTHAGTSVA